MGSLVYYVANARGAFARSGWRTRRTTSRGLEQLSHGGGTFGFRLDAGEWKTRLGRIDDDGVDFLVSLDAPFAGSSLKVKDATLVLELDPQEPVVLTRAEWAARAGSARILKSRVFSTGCEGDWRG